MHIDGKYALSAGDIRRVAGEGGAGGTGAVCAGSKGEGSAEC